MKKNPEKSIRQTIREELSWAKDDWTRDITDSVVKALGKKIDRMYVKLDKFVGDIETKRTEQKLHSGQHRQINDRLETVEKRIGVVQ